MRILTTTNLISYFSIGALLAILGWSQRKKINHPFTWVSFTVVFFFWPAILGHLTAKMIKR